MGAFAPPAGCPFLAPLFIRFGARTLRVSWFAPVRIAPHGEGVRSIGVCFQFTSDISRFSVAEHTAGGAEREG
eukprot:6192920-Pleurochrysis_carterae.AAC.1